MAMLTKASWPLLHELHLCLGMGLGPAAIVHLSAAKWPLEQLSLSKMPVNTATAAQLAKLTFSNLAAVCLIETGLTTAAVSEFTREEWPHLRSLNLVQNDLDSLALHYLCTMRLTAMTRLELAHTDITQAEAYSLVQASPQAPYCCLEGCEEAR